MISPRRHPTALLDHWVVFTDVSVSVTGLGKGLSTMRAGEGSFSCVRPHVNVQFVFANKAFTAAGARVGFVPSVVTLVHLQLCQATVRPAALWTFVAWPLIHVLPAVETQAAGGAEALVALQALKGFLPSVNEDVQF